MAKFLVPVMNTEKNWQTLPITYEYLPGQGTSHELEASCVPSPELLPEVVEFQRPKVLPYPNL